MPYDVLDSYRTVETFGGLDSQDVQRVIVRAVPSGVSFGVQFTANEATFNDPAALGRATAAIAGPYVEYVNTAMSTPGVAGVYSYDDFSASNTIETRWVVTITSTDGTLSTQRDIPFIDIRPERFPPIVSQTVASLDSLQTSGQ
jgi:hypothetical protein